MDHSIVRRFLELVPSVPNDDAGDEDLPADGSPARWLEIAEELGVPCPPELLALGEEQDRRAASAGPKPWRSAFCHAEALWGLARPDHARRYADLSPHGAHVGAGR